MLETRFLRVCHPVLHRVLAIWCIVNSSSCYAQVFMSDNFDRTAGVNAAGNMGGESSWGDNNNTLGGQQTQSYKVRNTAAGTSTEQQFVDGNLGRLRLGHGVVNIDLLTIPAILQNGFQASFDFQRGGSGYIAFAVGLTPDEIENHPQTNARIGVPFNTLIPETDFGFLFRPPTGGQGQTEIWKAGANQGPGPLGIFNAAGVTGSPTSLANSAVVKITPAVAGQWGVGAVIQVELTVNGAEIPQYTTTFVSDGSGVGYFGFHSNAGSGVAQAAIDNFVLTPIQSVATIESSFVQHGGWSGTGSAVDSGKFLHRQGPTSQSLTIDNLINTQNGINGIGFNVQGLANASGLGISDFEFQVSPTGAFDLGAFPPASWAAAPAPTSISVQGSAPSQVLIEWPNQQIMNRWLRVTVKATSNTGLAADEVYYLGHLLGESGPTDAVYTVAFADITPIRSAVGQSVDASSTVDIDKNGTVSFADISAMRSAVGSQLTNISVP